MVKGLDLFRERFRKFEGSFILIGGAACDEWFSSVGLEFRATKDLDIVLIIEAIDPEFVATLRAFIEEGEYEVRQCTEGTPVLYRFAKPKREEFPFMLEFFSRKPSGLDLAEGQKIVPFPTEPRMRACSHVKVDVPRGIVGMLVTLPIELLRGKQEDPSCIGNGSYSFEGPCMD